MSQNNPAAAHKAMIIATDQALENNAINAQTAKK